MLVSPVVVLIALISQSIFATGILAPRAGASDALPEGVHPLEPYLSSQLQSSAIQPGGNSPNVIRGLLFHRQLTCPRGYGLCRNGRCCPTNGLCCNAGGCCSAGNFCCGVGNCCPTGSSCCSDGGCCRAGTVCWLGGGCCPVGEICSGPAPPPITIGNPGNPTLTRTLTRTSTTESPIDVTLTSATTTSSPFDVTLTNTIVTPVISPTFSSPIVPTFSSPAVTTSPAISNPQLSRATTLLPGWMHLMSSFVSGPLIMAVIYL